MSAPVDSDASLEYPIRIGSPETFRGLRALLVAAAFDEPTVARRLGGHSLAGVPRLADGRKTLAGEIGDANAALIRLFIDGESLPQVQLVELLQAEGVALFTSLGLLAPSVDDASRLSPTVILAPVSGLWLVSDLIPTAASRAAEIRQDYVYSALNELTGAFLRAIPSAPGARVLELCAGTGVAAINAVRQGAASAVATDLIPRCVHFARFNACLNGMDDRVTVLESDVWSALDGKEFDLIVAHPPYVPALSHRFDFRDAGEDGEHVTRRIVEGAAAHLGRGGRLIIRAALSDRGGVRIADRVRAWLGPAASEFDLVQIEASEYGLLDAYKGVTKGGADYVDCERWLRHFTALGIERFAVCLLELRRDAYGRAPITERRSLGVDISPAVAEWHFQWARFLAAGGDSATARLRGGRPRVVPLIRTAVHLEAQPDGGWQTVGATVETS